MHLSHLFDYKYYKVYFMENDNYKIADPRKMSVYSAYRAGKISKEVYQKYFKDGYNVKTTLIEVL